MTHRTVPLDLLVRVRDALKLGGKRPASLLALEYQ